MIRHRETSSGNWRQTLSPSRTGFPMRRATGYCQALLFGGCAQSCALQFDQGAIL